MSHQPAQFIPNFDNPDLLINTAFIKYIGCNERTCKVTAPQADNTLLDVGFIGFTRHGFVILQPNAKKELIVMTE
jgi:hypothetical protein